MAVTLRCAAHERAVTPKMTLSLILSAYRGGIQVSFSCASSSCPLFLNQFFFKTAKDFFPFLLESSMMERKRGRQMRQVKKPTAHLLPLRGKKDSMRWNRVLVSVNIRPY